MKDLRDDNEPSQPSPPPPDYDEATEEHEQRHTTLIQHHDRPTKVRLYIDPLFFSLLWLIQ